MKTELPKFVWLLSVAFLLLMLSDAYLLPTKKIADKIDHFEVISSGDFKSHWRTPILFTQSGLKLMLPERNVYNYGDTSKLTIVKGFIFGTNLGIEINADGNRHYFSSCIFSRTTGAKFLLFITVLALLFNAYQIIAKKKLKEEILYLAVFILIYLSGEYLFNVSIYLLK